MNVGGSAYFEGGAVADSQTSTVPEFVTSNGGTIVGPAVGGWGNVVGNGTAKAFAFIPTGSAIQGTTTYKLGTPYNFG